MTSPLGNISAGITDCGTVRPINEDALLERPRDGLWVVADGMGGHDAGEVASAMIVDSLRELPLGGNLPDLVDMLEDCLLEVHQRVRHYSRTQCEGRTVGSTVAMLLVRGSAGICLWVGDSRLYRYRSGEFVQLSHDHSQINELVSRGVMSLEEAMRTVAGNVITRAVGAADALYVDVNLFEVCAGDVFLLCTDGLYGAVSEERMAEIISSEAPADSVFTLRDVALANQARDNVTAIVVRVD